MKKGDILIFVYAILLLLSGIGVGYSLRGDKIEKQKEISENEDKFLEDETEVQRKKINASVITKYNGKEIIVYSDTTCFFNLGVSICDGETISSNSYGEFKIASGETITLTIEDLAPDFFSENAIITSVSDVGNPYVYGESSISDDKYKLVDNSIIMKYSEKEITVYSNNDCYFDLHVSTQDSKFNSSNEYKKIKISKGETLTLALNDLAPEFFLDDTIIKYCDPYICTYIEK